MPASQTLLFPDPRPLVERLGEEFFRQLPARPGVYLMRDAVEVVLYVGKAKSLRHRLSRYRVANPDRMGRRHLRLLRQVVRIELQECADEMAALAREAELLRALKPKFNRAGVWPATPRFLVWRSTDADFGVGHHQNARNWLARVRTVRQRGGLFSGRLDSPTLVCAESGLGINHHAARLVAWTDGSDRDP